MANSTARALVNLSSLPLELRRQIWDHVAETHDLTPVLATSRWTRQDIMARLPGGIPTCPGVRCRPKACDRPVDEIRVIVEPWCSDHSWLKLVLRRHKSESVWTMRQIDGTFLTSQLRNYPARRVVVEFHPPAQARVFRLAAFLTLRAKLYDVCVLLGGIRLTGDETELEIVFRDASPDVRARWKHSFWEDSPTMIDARRLGFRCSPKQWYWCTIKQYPFYYECLMLPLILHPIWRNAAVRFDGREPKRRSTSAAAFPPNGPALQGPGYKALSLLNWDYCEELMNDVTMIYPPAPRPRYDKSYMESCRASILGNDSNDPTPRAWGREYAKLVSRKLQNFHTDIRLFLDIISRAPEAAYCGSGPLRAAVARLARTRKGAFNPSYATPPVELRLDHDQYVADESTWVEIKSPSYYISSEGSEMSESEASEPDLVEVYYNRGEGRGRWRWTSASAKETYILWAEEKEEDDGARWRRRNEWRFAPVPQPDCLVGE